MRRESLPQAKLEDIPSIIYNCSISTREQLQEVCEIEKDSIRLVEILGYIKKISSYPAVYEKTKDGKLFENYSEIEQLLSIYLHLFLEEEILPPYFTTMISKIIPCSKNSIYTKEQLSHDLGCRDLWSIEILVDWFHSFSITLSEHEPYRFSTTKLSQLQLAAFLFLLKETYSKYAHRTKIVPVHKLRWKIKDSGLIKSDDEFENYLKKLLDLGLDVLFSPASRRKVGYGLKSIPKSELIEILSFPSYEDIDYKEVLSNFV